MANFSRVKALGWSLLEKLTSAQQNQLDIDHTKAINGDEGSTHAPTTQIVLAGQGLQVTGDFKASSCSQHNMTSTNRITLASRSVTRLLPWSPITRYGTDFSATGLPGNLTGLIANAQCTIPLRIPHAAVLTGYAVLIQGAAHGGTWPPSLPNRVGLYRTSLADGAPVNIDTFKQDSTAVQATYESLHWLIQTGLNFTIDRSLESYALSFLSESGTNNVSGVQIMAARVTYNATIYDED